MDGDVLIGIERQRQKHQEGWTAAHDDQHTGGELLDAALCYAYEVLIPTRPGPTAGWPWDPTWWKPSADPVRNLVKAGALIAAEIDRRLRLQVRQVGAAMGIPPELTEAALAGGPADPAPDVTVALPAAPAAG